MNVDIKRISETETGGAWVMAYIPRFAEVKQYFTNNMAKAWLEIDDNRRISADQRKKIYALFGDIANYTGHFREEIKDIMKTEFITTNGKEYFSLSNLDMTTASELIDFIIEFCMIYNIPFKTKTADLLKDLEKWSYICLKYRKCVCCGKKASVHHLTGSRVQMGHDRTKISNIGRQVISICEHHHQEIHQDDEQKFFKKHLVRPVMITEQNIKELKL